MTEKPKKKTRGENRISIYPSPSIHELLTAHRKGEGAKVENLSLLMGTAVARYLETVRRSTPILSGREWCLIFDSLNGGVRDDPFLVPDLAHGISDSISLDHLDEKWGVDGAALLNKLQEMAYPQLMVICEQSERFWDTTVQAGPDTIVEKMGLPEPLPPRPPLQHPHS